MAGRSVTGGEYARATPPWRIRASRGGRVLGVELPVLALLVAAAGLAGFVDAVAGGGGLVQMPLLLRFLSPAAAPGVNKASSVCGTTAALVRYARNGNVRWRIVLLAGPLAFAGSLAGTLGYLEVVRAAAPAIRPGFAACFLLLAAHQAWKAFRGPGDGAAPRRRVAAGLPFMAAIGVYDGFFGPGAGMFLFWALTTWFGLEALDATGTTKALNAVTNLAALAAFAAGGHVLWALGLSMAVANVAGGLLGAHAAIRRGARFIRLLTASVSAVASVYLLVS